MNTPDVKLVEALLHTLLESYGNENIYHPDGSTYNVDQLRATYLRTDAPTGRAMELEQYESSLDSVAHEVIGMIQDPRVDKAYFNFRALLQTSIQARYPTTKFSNF